MTWLGRTKDGGDSTVPSLARNLLRFGSGARLRRARADTISLSASSTYSVDHLPSQTLSAARPPDLVDPDISPSATGFRGSKVFGHDYSSQPTGVYQFGSRSSGESTYSITGSANYTNTFTVGARGAYAFHFDIDPGELSVELANFADGTQSASLGVLITETIGSGIPLTLFDYNASMSVTGQVFNARFSETGGTLNPAGPALALGAGDYNWEVYHGAVSLGTPTKGELVTVSETLTSSATGTSSTHFCVGDGTGPGAGGGDSSFALFSDSRPGCGTALARIGDPPTLPSRSWRLRSCPGRSPSPRLGP